MKRALFISIIFFTLTSCGSSYIVRPNYVKWESWSSSQIVPFILIKTYEILLTNADSSTFIAINEYYGKDKYHVYYMGSEIYHADPASFQILNSKIPSQFKYWYHSDFSCDSNHMFYAGNLITNADNQSFNIINEHYWRDNRFIYYYHDNDSSFVCLTNSDIQSFMYLGNRFSKDSHRAYYMYYEFTPYDLHSLTNSSGDIDSVKDNYFYYKPRYKLLSNDIYQVIIEKTKVDN